MKGDPGEPPQRNPTVGFFWTCCASVSNDTSRRQEARATRSVRVMGVIASPLREPLQLHDASAVRAPISAQTMADSRTHFAAERSGLAARGLLAARPSRA